jgi:hypothetical protein
MSSPPDDSGADPRALQQIKRKYQKLQNLRVHSAKQDSDDLREKIAEHRRVHEVYVHELRSQNGGLMKKIRAMQDDADETDRLRDRVQRLRDDLEAHDPVLAVFLRHPGFSIRVIAKRSFEIRAGDEDELVFTLAPTRGTGSGDDLRFHFSAYPPEMARHPGTEFVAKKDGTFRSAGLQSLCDHLRKGLEVARVWNRQQLL